MIVAAEGGGSEGWTMGPGITNTAIKQEFDVKWLCVGEDMLLQGFGEDYDLANGDPHGNYVNDSGWAISTWESRFDADISPFGRWALYQPWEPTGVGGAPVILTVRDDPELPHGADTNDPDVECSRQMYAYMVQAALTYEGSATQGGVLTITQCGSSDSVLTPILSLADSITANIDRLSDEFTADAASTWCLTVYPEAATLDTGGILATRIYASTVGTMRGVSGPEKGPECSVSVALTGGSGTGAGVTVTISSVDDTYDSAAGIGFAFSSDLLADEGHDKIESNDGHGDEVDYDFGYQPGGGPRLFTGLKGTTTQAKAIVSAKVEVRDVRLLPIFPVYATATAEEGSYTRFWLYKPWYHVTEENYSYILPEAGFFYWWQ